MEFGGFQKLTVLDYPGHVACIVFTKGCNFLCPFCHNALLLNSENGETYKDEEILSFLKKRQKVLDGICVSGGEPLIHPELEGFLREVKALGYDIKLDTNGSYPERLASFVNCRLIDYVAMDVKNIPYKYAQTAGALVSMENIEKSIDFLLSSGIDYEFRTTVSKELHSPSDIEKIAERISGAKKYFIQNFVDSGNVLRGNLTPVSEEDLNEMAERSRKFVDFVKIR